MAYKDNLNPWCIIRSFPNKQSQCIVRFHRCSDAQAHLQILKANNPGVTYEIIFDVKPEHSDSTFKRQILQFEEMDWRNHEDSVSLATRKVKAGEIK